MEQQSSPVRQLFGFGSSLVLIGVFQRIVHATAHPLSTARIIPIILFVLWVILLIPFLYRTVLGFVVSQNKSSAFLQALYHQGLFATLWEIYRHRKFSTTRLPILVGFWGIVISITVSILFEVRLFDGLQKKFVPMSQNLNPHAVVFMLESKANDDAGYLDELENLIASFKSAGVRAVVAAIPAWGIRDSTSLRTMQETGIACLYPGHKEYSRRMKMFPAAYGSIENEGNILLSLRSSLEPLERRERIFRWQPCIQRGGQLSLDVNFAATAKFLGYPDTVRPIMKSSSVSLGSITVPVLSNGVASSLESIRFDKIFLRMGVESDWQTGAVLSQDAISNIRDKVVVVENIGMGTWKSDNPTAQANIIESLIQNRVVNDFERPVLPLVVLAIIISALACVKLQLKTAIPALFVIGSLLFVIDTQLLVSVHVYLNLAYVAAAVFLSGVVFTLLRWTHEHP